MPPGGRCVTADIDLEALATAYAHRPLSEAGRRHAEAAVAGVRRGERALDVGGGPGTHAAVWASQGVDAVVLDPAAGMVTSSAGRGVTAVRGRSEAMPFRPASFAVVYFHLSIHYGNWRTAAAEAHRVLAPGGTLWVWTLGPDHHEQSFLSRWFPSVPALDRSRFPDPAALADHLRDLGDVEMGFEVEDKQRPAGEWAAAVEAGFISTLQLVPAAELAAGLQSFRSQHPDPAELLNYELRWTWLVVRC